MPVVVGTVMAARMGNIDHDPYESDSRCQQNVPLSCGYRRPCCGKPRRCSRGLQRDSRHDLKEERRSFSFAAYGRRSGADRPKSSYTTEYSGMDQAHAGQIGQRACEHQHINLGEEALVLTEVSSLSLARSVESDQQR